MRQRFVVVLAVLLAAAALLAVPATRVPVFLSVGQLLIADQAAISHVDVVIVAVDAGTAGLLEAAELMRDGVASSVATFAGRPSRVDLALLARGVPLEDTSAVHRRQLNSLGVESVVPIPPVSGTEDQARVLPDWCDDNGLRSVLIVTSWHHSRRVQRVLERSMRGHGTRVQFRVAQHSEFGPENWWQERDGVRTVMTEIQKLMIDMVRHPFA